MRKVYLDYASTAPTLAAVRDEMVEVMEKTFGNPSSIHSFGREAHRLLQAAREICGNSIGCHDSEIIFTSGGTESDNLAILETAFLKKNEGKHLITSQVEHHAVLKTMQFLETQGFEVTYLPVDEKGNLTVESVVKALRPDTILVSLMMGNNETGKLFPIREIGEVLKNHPAYFHTDAVQAYGNEAIDMTDLQVDLLSISGHKIGGPRGVGFLYVKKGLRFEGLFHGGQQEYKKRPGTENLPGICGLGKAAALCSIEKRIASEKKYKIFQERILSELRVSGIPFEINGEVMDKLPQILNLWIKGVPSQRLLLQLDLAGIAASAGSACTAGNVEPSHVLAAMYGKDHPAVNESIRVSFGAETSLEEVEIFISTLKGLVGKGKAEDK